MKCYKCGMRLSEKDYCTNCGCDVSLYKKIIYASNRLYNEGLERAEVRDLSGAAECLRECLKLNKANVDARNLLGLIHYERGEIVEALSEWVVSRNLRSKKNLADDYLNSIQENPGTIDQMNQTIRKFNLALGYCEQGGYDIAVIQLKKVLSMNPKYLKAHQLLALLYIKDKEWAKARREAEAALAIDTGNLITTRYLKEINEQDDTSVKEEKPKEAFKYTVDNQTIIQPLNRKERTIWMTALNLLVGVGLGLAIFWFLILPGQLGKIDSTKDEELMAVSEQLDAKTSKLSQVEKELDEQKSDNALLREELAAYEGTDTVMEELQILLEAAKVYADPETEVTEKAVALLKVDTERLLLMEDTTYMDLYNNIFESIAEEAAEAFYDAGITAYRAGDAQTAMEQLELAVTFDPADSYAWYNLGKACRDLSVNSRAIEAFNKVIELAPGSERAKQSKVYINELSEE